MGFSVVPGKKSNKREEEACSSTPLDLLSVPLFQRAIQVMVPAFRNAFSCQPQPTGRSLRSAPLVPPDNSHPGWERNKSDSLFLTHKAEKQNLKNLTKLYDFIWFAQFEGLLSLSDCVMLLCFKIKAVSHVWSETQPSVKPKSERRFFFWLLVPFIRRDHFGVRFSVWVI